MRDDRERDRKDQVEAILVVSLRQSHGITSATFSVRSEPLNTPHPQGERIKRHLLKGGVNLFMGIWNMNSLNEY